MVYIELCGGAHTTQRQVSTQIPIGFCVNLLVSVPVSDSVNGPLTARHFSRRTLLKKHMKMKTDGRDRGWGVVKCSKLRPIWVSDRQL